MNSKVIVAVVSAIGLVIVFSVFKPVSSIPKELLCYSDSECVPAETCHPTSCINVDSQVKQETSFCTSECVPGTMDCGQGSCKCINNQCGVVLSE